MLNGLQRVFRFSRAAAADNLSIPSVSAEDAESDETLNERTNIDANDPPKSEFEPEDRQRDFGRLHYTVNSGSRKFKKMMIIGIVNVFLILAFFLFMFLFVVQPNVHGGETAVTTISPTTPPRECAISPNTFSSKIIIIRLIRPFNITFIQSHFDNCTNNYKNHCYIQVDQSATIPVAQRICQARCSNLPPVYSVTVYFNLQVQRQKNRFFWRYRFYT